MNLAQIIADTARRYRVEPALALEVAVQESRLNPNAVSPKGAIGVMQLMPATAAELGVDPWDPVANIDGGVRYLRQQLSRFGDVAKALAAYNWGPANLERALRRHGDDWLGAAPAETQNYVATILRNLETQYQARVEPAAPVTALIERASQQDPEFLKKVVLVVAVALGLFFVLSER